MVYHIDLAFDDEVKVWTATSEDIPGLVLESGSIDSLADRLKVVAPEMLKTNCFLQDIPSPST